MLEEEFSDNKRIKIIGVVLVSLAVLVIVFFLVNTFILKPEEEPKTPSQLPPLPSGVEAGSPEEVAIRYLQEVQEGEEAKAEEYLYSIPNPSLAQVKIFREGYQQAKLNFVIQQEQEEEEKETVVELPDPEFQVKKSEIKRKMADVTIEEKTNKEEGSLFFGFILPGKITFKFTLIKSNDEWKITEIDSPTFILDSKIGGETEVKENLFITLTKVEPYTPQSRKSATGVKFFSLKVEYKNRSEKHLGIQPLKEWKIIPTIGEDSSPIKSGVYLRLPVLKDSTIKAGQTKKGYVSFIVPTDFTIKEVVFTIPEKRVIFSFSQEVPTLTEEELLKLQK